MAKDKLTPKKVDQFLAKIKPHPVVAVVDDDQASVDLLHRTLHDEGYEIRTFKRAEDLIAKLGEIQPDAVITEIVLSGMSGLSALEDLRPANPEEILPVLILTHKNDPRSKVLAFRRGAFDYVTKPFDAEEVAARIRSLVRAKLVQDVLRASSLSDPLTTLYNRRFLVSWLDREIARVKRYALPFSCLAVDIDGFDDINEKCGENFGDFVLKKFAGLMTENTRQSDIVGRFEDDEFMIFLPGTSREQATVVAHRLRKTAAEKGFQQGRQKTTPSFSIGIAGCNPSEPVPPAAAFLERAQEALGKAKAIGTGETAVLGMD
ncbi:MAG: diguanylate cyclase [Candidatus Omnitrophica bacterium]|nr:diguanylate cyclase [Candidatus Omnitrophota bacterium]